MNSGLSYVSACFLRGKDEREARMQTNEAEPISAIDRRVPTLSDTRGKHWILAEVKRLEQEARFLETLSSDFEQKELEELDKMDKVSASLPETAGHINSSWDRWFEGPQDVKRCRCWIL
ncbi:hypothetical protein ZIOFF_020334 [Zingiber officinale]|uniref:Uncharacterized protein n=1 Tax=Zingiber officinale TaxID=94328 RepID=A0A8J5H029_ZINOF|nr:hypothetical protein ZIOFF_020334 [Zingiber officinale]